MKKDVNPVVAIVIIVVVLAGVGLFLWNKTAGKTFTKEEATNGSDSFFSGGKDVSK